MGRLTDKIVKVYNIEGYRNYVYDEGTDKQYEFRLNIACECVPTKNNLDKQQNNGDYINIFSRGDVYDMYSVEFNELYSPEFAFAFDQFLDVKVKNQEFLDVKREKQVTFRNFINNKDLVSFYAKIDVGKNGDYESRMSKFLEKYVPVIKENDFAIRNIISITLLRKMNYKDVFLNTVNVASTTFASDLVPVPPMNSPTGRFTWLDMNEQ